MSYQTIEVTVADHVLTATMRRPARKNTLGDLSLEELHSALDEAECSSAIRALVLQGSDGVFSAGMDLEEASDELDDGGRAGRARFFRLLRRFSESRCLVVCAVDGRADGGGVGLVAACDFVFASERSRFALPEALWGLRPTSVLPFLVRRVGFQLAYTMTLSTLPIDARKAERAGLVDELAEPPYSALQRLLARVARLPPDSIASTKRALAPLSPIGADTEAAVLRELDELFASAQVQRTLAAYSGPDRRLPWER